MNKGTCRHLETRLAALHEASLQLVRDLRPDDVLERIVNIAREQTEADYAALGVLDEEGELAQFVQLGMNQEKLEKIPHPPEVVGLLGASVDEEKPTRIAELGEHPRSLGLPPDHPRMSAFLSIPIMSSGRKWGQIYLAKREKAPAFSQDDERVMGTLAAYAAVAIENARLYDQVLQRDQILVQRFDQINLLNNLARISGTTSDMDELQEAILDHVLAHFDAQAGDIFLRDEDGNLLWQQIHRGEAAEAFETRGRFLLGEGLVGSVAERSVIMEARRDQSDSELARPALLEAGFDHIACIPLVASNKTIGVI